MNMKKIRPRVGRTSKISLCRSATVCLLSQIRITLSRLSNTILTAVSYASWVRAKPALYTPLFSPLKADKYSVNPEDSIKCCDTFILRAFSNIRLSTPPRIKYTHPPDSDMQSTSGRYASYWNAFLFFIAACW